MFATTSMNIWANLRLARQMNSRKPRLEAKHLIRDDDLPWLEVSSATPVACQIDGDYIGEREMMRFTAVAGALQVVAPRRRWAVNGPELGKRPQPEKYRACFRAQMGRA